MEARAQWLGEDAWNDAFDTAWSHLVERCPTASIFQTPEWVSSWWKHLGKGRLTLLAIHHGDRLTALVPFVTIRERRYGLTFDALTLAGEPLADRMDFLHDPEFDGVTAAADAIAERARTCDVIRMPELTMDAAEETAVLEAAGRNGVRFVRRQWSRSPVLRLDGPWEEIESAYPRTLRTRLRRARKKQSESGGLAFRRWQPAPEELDALLEKFRALEERSWKGEERVGIFSTAASRAFVRDVSGKFARRGWLDVATLTAGEELVAYRYGFRFRGVFLDYNLAHDPAHMRMAPGRTLLDDIIRDSHRAGMQAVDASRGRVHPPHLLADWTGESRWHSLVVLFGPGPRGRALAMIEGTLKPLARRWLLRKPPAPATESTP